MKKQLLKTMLLLTVMFAGVGNVWAEGEKTYTMTIDSGTKNGTNNVHWTTLGQTLTWNNISWTTSVTNQNESNAAGITNSNSYFQIGSKNKPAATVVISTNGFAGKEIVSASLDGYCMSTEGPTLTITAGETKMLENKALDKSTTNTSSTYSSTTNNIALGSNDALTFTITSSVGAAICISKIEVVWKDVEADPSKTANGLAYEASEVEKSMGDEIFINPLTNPYNLDITYSSTNTSVATVSTSTGEVTILTDGETTIKASFAGNDTYASGTVSYKLVVNKAIVDGLFDFESKLFDYGSGVTTTTDGNTYITDTKTWTAGNVTLVTSGKYRWWDKDGTLRFYNSDTSAATLSVPNGYAIKEIVIVGINGKLASTAETGEYSASGTTGTWSGLAQTVKLTTSTLQAKTITVTYIPVESVTVTSVGYATFSSTNALDFTGKDIAAYIATADGTTGVNFSRIYKVPAETGVLLVAEGGATANVPYLTDDADDAAGNVLVAATAEIASLASTEGTKSNYILNSPNGKTGFYPANGQKVGAGKAYIQIDSDAPVKGFIALPGSDADGVQRVEAETQGTEAVYNLAGQRMSRAQLRPGLYIVNGKKVMVK